MKGCGPSTAGFSIGFLKEASPKPATVYPEYDCQLDLHNSCLSRGGDAAMVIGPSNAKEYMRRASELRALAPHMTVEENRLTVLHCAQAYEKLARTCESAHE